MTTDMLSICFLIGQRHKGLVLTNQYLKNFKKSIGSKKIQNKIEFFDFGWGRAAPQTSETNGFWLDPPTHTLKRSYFAFDRGGQTRPPRSNDVFGAADGTGAADDRPKTEIRKKCLD